MVTIQYHVPVYDIFTGEHFGNYKNFKTGFKIYFGPLLGVFNVSDATVSMLVRCVLFLSVKELEHCYSLIVSTVCLTFNIPVAVSRKKTSRPFKQVQG